MVADNLARLKGQNQQNQAETTKVQTAAKCKATKQNQDNEKNCQGPPQDRAAIGGGRLEVY